MMGMSKTRSYHVNGWIIQRDPVILQGAGMFAAFGHGFHIGFNMLRDARAWCSTHPPRDQDMQREYRDRIKRKMSAWIVC